MYDVIYADPPWKFSSRGARGGMYGELDYPTMTLAEMKAMRVQDVAADNCALFMWSTSAHVFEAHEVAKAWGFKYVRIDKIWHKNRPVVGPWGMSDMEPLLLFVKGKMCSEQAVRNQKQVYSADRDGKHSEKPSLFRTLIEERFPEASKLEMFARQASDGWDVFGNEVDNSIRID